MNKTVQFTTPVLLIIFNRPALTKLVFEQIKKVKPKFLYIAADGPRLGKNNEAAKCAESRSITESVDWDCKVKRLYQTSNLGCGKGVSTAIEWFFKNEPEGIILEDDCLPSMSFFNYCQKMLDRYRSSKEVMLISGDNFLPQNKQDANIYYLSKYVHIWGWATWRDRWKKYSFSMEDWNKLGFIRKFKSLEGNFWERLYWMASFEAVANQSIDTWDYQWVYTVMKNKGLSVVPGTNLIANIGFGKDSTHTKIENQIYANLEQHQIKSNIKKASYQKTNYLYEYESDDIFRFRSIKTVVSFIYYATVIKLALLIKK